uniref:zinc-ribbon domain-containing protein n=1 Tax=Paracoccus binzhouensis TaxID=2796149 RepID=UPI0018EF2B0D
MRLTCPRCGAQYEIAESAIPALGREVECSACSHVWFQPGAGKSAGAAAAGPYDPQERPALNRALDESVLAILREEAARELQARKAETRPHGADHIPATAETGPGAVPEIDWPATTLTESAVPAAGEAAPIQAEPAAAKAPAREAAAPAGAGTEEAAAQAAETLAAETAAPVDDEPPGDDARTVEHRAAEPVADDPLTTDPAPSTDWPDAAAPALPDAAELAATLTRAGPPRPAEAEEPTAAPE